MKYYYPAVFSPAGDGIKGYEIEIPDIPGCFTCGDDMDECHWMAQDAMGLMLEDIADEKDYPAPSEIGDIDLSNYPAGSFVSFVCFDKEKYDADKNPIKTASENAGFDAKKIAEILGAPLRTVQSWLNGKRTPPPWVERLVVEKIQNAM